MAHFIDMDICRKHAGVRGKPQIVCGNSDYILRIHPDAEWDCAEDLTALLLYRRGNETVSAHIPVIGGQCAVPVLTETTEISVGVYADCIRTAVPAVIPCVPCITDLRANRQTPHTDVFNSLMELLAEQQAKDRIRHGLHMELGFFTHGFLSRLTHAELGKENRR